MVEGRNKSIPFVKVKAASDSGRVRTGICSVFGHVDDWGDRIHPGAFKKAISEGRNRVKHLWNHDFGSLPTATIKEIKELSRDELPAEVFEYAPNATGGLLVSREYHEDDFSDMILKRIDAGDITEMSFGFDVKKYEITEEGDGIDRKTIRELKELSLFDTSDVLWGMNDATVAAFAKNWHQDEPLGLIVQKLQIVAHNIKAGRRNAAADQALIDQLHDISVDLGSTKCVQLEATDDDTSSQASNAKGREAEAVTTADTPLLANSLKLNDLRLSQLIRRQ
jgi:uncharacterized protein